MPIAEQDAIMASGQQIASLDGLEGLPAADRARLRTVIESQAPVS